MIVAKKRHNLSDLRAITVRRISVLGSACSGIFIAFWLVLFWHRMHPAGIAVNLLFIGFHAFRVAARSRYRLMVRTTKGDYAVLTGRAASMIGAAKMVIELLRRSGQVVTINELDLSAPPPS